MAKKQEIKKLSNLWKGQKVNYMNQEFVITSVQQIFTERIYTLRNETKVLKFNVNDSKQNFII